MLSRTNLSTPCIWHFCFISFDVESQQFITHRNLDLPSFVKYSQLTISMMPLLFLVLLPANTLPECRGAACRLFSHSGTLGNVLCNFGCLLLPGRGFGWHLFFFSLFHFFLLLPLLSSGQINLCFPPGYLNETSIRKKKKTVRIITKCVLTAY